MTFNPLDKNGFIFAVSTLWGKITDAFDGLAKVAKSGNYIDLTNKPTIPSGANNLTTTEAGKYLDATQGKVLDDKISELNRKSVYGTPLQTNDDLNNLINDRYYCTNLTDVVLSLKNRPPVDAGEMGVLWLPFTPNNRQGMQIAMSKSGLKAYVHIRIKDVSIWSDWNLTHTIA